MISQKADKWEKKKKKSFGENLHIILQSPTEME